MLPVSAHRPASRRHIVVSQDFRGGRRNRCNLPETEAWALALCTKAVTKHAKEYRVHFVYCCCWSKHRRADIRYCLGCFPRSSTSRRTHRWQSKLNSRFRCACMTYSVCCDEQIYIDKQRYSTYRECCLVPRFIHKRRMYSLIKWQQSHKLLHVSFVPVRVLTLLTPATTAAFLLPLGACRVRCTCCRLACLDSKNTKRARRSY